MKTQLYTAATRGHAYYGWLNTHYSFSFANYYKPERIHFGALRVLNDDIIEAGQGFGKHPHDNMEIITIPLQGALAHADSMGFSSVIHSGDVQVMSAGTGIYHSEFNASQTADAHILQIWIFPRQKGIKPRYHQLSIRELARPNSFYQLVSPSANDKGAWINADAWLHLGDFAAGHRAQYQLRRPGNGIYLFLISGRLKVAEHTLGPRDALALTELSAFELEAQTPAQVLLIEVPMQW